MLRVADTLPGAYVNAPAPSLVDVPPLSRPPAPFLKWAGGKRQLLPDLDAFLPSRSPLYIEPFIGGGAVFFHRRAMSRCPLHFKLGKPVGILCATCDRAKQWGDEKIVIGDANGELAIAYATIRDDVYEVIRHLSTYKNDATMYYKTRAIDPEDLDEPARAARFLYLNRVCFNGLYRENQAGKFNVPFGRYKNPQICDSALLRADSEALHGVSAIVQADFERVVQMALAISDGLRGAVIYCDPPYWPVSKTANFVGYQGKGFGPDEQRRLRDAARRWRTQGAKVVLSNADVEPIRRLYEEDFAIHRVLARRAINSKSDKRGTVGEVIIVGDPIVAVEYCDPVTP